MNFLSLVRFPEKWWAKLILVLASLIAAMLIVDIAPIPPIWLVPFFPLGLDYWLGKIGFSIIFERGYGALVLGALGTLVGWALYACLTLAIVVIPRRLAAQALYGVLVLLLAANVTGCRLLAL